MKPVCSEMKRLWPLEEGHQRLKKLGATFALDEERIEKVARKTRLPSGKWAYAQYLAVIFKLFRVLNARVAVFQLCFSR